MAGRAEPNLRWVGGQAEASRARRASHRPAAVQEAAPAAPGASAARPRRRAAAGAREAVLLQRRRAGAPVWAVSEAPRAPPRDKVAATASLAVRGRSARPDRPAAGTRRCKPA